MVDVVRRVPCLLVRRLPVALDDLPGDLPLVLYLLVDDSHHLTRLGQHFVVDGVVRVGPPDAAQLTQQRVPRRQVLHQRQGGHESHHTRHPAGDTAACAEHPAVHVDRASRDGAERDDPAAHLGSQLLRDVCRGWGWLVAGGHLHDDAVLLERPLAGNRLGVVDVGVNLAGIHGLRHDKCDGVEPLRRPLGCLGEHGHLVLVRQDLVGQVVGPHDVHRHELEVKPLVVHGQPGRLSPPVGLPLLLILCHVLLDLLVALSAQQLHQGAGLDVPKTDEENGPFSPQCRAPQKVRQLVGLNRWWIWCWCCCWLI
mmetsp:Transcript_36041/g.103534  ORF Transcript_36041/g.103534 Transcript_36041/m.103534 type:complete len:311 (+) Transcript_36041:548-1480(+)